MSHVAVREGLPHILSCSPSPRRDKADPDRSRFRCRTIPLTAPKEVTEEISDAGGWFLPSVISFLNHHRKDILNAPSFLKPFEADNDDKLLSYQANEAVGHLEVFDTETKSWVGRWFVLHTNYLFEYSGINHQSSDICVGAVPLQNSQTDLGEYTWYQHLPSDQQFAAQMSTTHPITISIWLDQGHFQRLLSIYFINYSLIIIFQPYCSI